MADYNHITLVGRPTNKPEFSGKEVERVRATFTIAVNRPYKDSSGNNVSDFFQVIAWGKLAEVVGEYVEKGKDILVDGRLQSRSYEQDGATKWITEVVLENFTFLGKKTPKEGA